MNIVQIQVDRNFFLDKKHIKLSDVNKYCTKCLKKAVVHYYTSFDLAEVKLPLTCCLEGYPVAFSIMGYNHYRLFYCKGVLDDTQVVVLYALFTDRMYIIPANIIKIEKELAENSAVKFELCERKGSRWVREFNYRKAKSYILAVADKCLKQDGERIKCLTYRSMAACSLVKAALDVLSLEGG